MLRSQILEKVYDREEKKTEKLWSMEFFCFTSVTLCIPMVVASIYSDW